VISVPFRLPCIYVGLQYLAELALTKYESLQFKASVLAAAALLCARHVLKHSPLWVRCSTLA
jgi:hypothetical protein